jgi:hypothetical protein
VPVTAVTREGGGVIELQADCDMAMTSNYLIIMFLAVTRMEGRGNLPPKFCLSQL